MNQRGLCVTYQNSQCTQLTILVPQMKPVSGVSKCGVTQHIQKLATKRQIKPDEGHTSPGFQLQHSPD